MPVERWGLSEADATRIQYGILCQNAGPSSGEGPVGRRELDEPSR
jgi:hypothetical protein